MDAREKKEFKKYFWQRPSNGGNMKDLNKTGKEYPCNHKVMIALRRELDR